MLELRRGDYRTLNVSGLTDAADAPTTFAVDDIVRWTAKMNTGQTDAQAIIRKSSVIGVDEPGGIVIAVGDDTAVITLLPDDFDELAPQASDRDFVWDLQLAPGGDEDLIVTLVSGTGTILADVTITAP